MLTTAMQVVTSLEYAQATQIVLKYVGRKLKKKVKGLTKISYLTLIILSKRKAIAEAGKFSLRSLKPTSYFNIMETLTIYAVQGTGFTSVNLLNAIKRAKETANKKAVSFVTKDGQVFASVNYKGVLKSA